MTYSVLSDLHVNAFLKTEKIEGGTDYPNTRLAAFSMNASCQEGPRQYSDLRAHHKEILRAMDTEGFDRMLEPRRPMFKFANDYMKFVACILMFLSATREGNWELHLESLKSL